MSRRPPQSTRTDTPFPESTLFRALTAARLRAWFVAGVIAGTLLAMAAGPYRKPVLLGFVGIVLALAASSGVGLSDTLATTAMTVAMGGANAIFQRDEIGRAHV